MSSYTITLLPGDGIGPEITEATIQVLEATGLAFHWERFDKVGASAIDEYGTPLPDHVLDSIRRNKIALKGPITTPVGKGFKSVNVALRQKLDLYANVRPCSSLPGISSPFHDVNLVIFRENTEDLYAGIETFDERLEIADSVARITRRGSERIMTFCLEWAYRNGLKKMTVAHKANILKIAHGMFLRIGQEIATKYPDVEFGDKIIDNLCMQLVTRPSQFEGIVTTNLFGDIISDLAAGLVGGLGVVAGANFGDEYAVFEAVHGSAPDIAGQNKANPTAMIRSAEMMARHLGALEAADIIKQVLYDTFAEGKYVTADLGGNCSTSQFADIISDRVQARVAA